MVVAMYFLGTSFLVLSAAIVAALLYARGVVNEARATVTRASDMVQKAERLTSEAKAIVGSIGTHIESAKDMVPSADTVKNYGGEVGSAIFGAMKTFAMGKTVDGSVNNTSAG